MKIKSHKLTAIIMVRRDELKKGALELRLESDKALQAVQEQVQEILQKAKTSYHAAKIQANRMEREAELLQEALNEEMELQVKQEQEAAAAWDVKSNSHLRAELQTDDTLMELIKKVN